MIMPLSLVTSASTSETFIAPPAPSLAILAELGIGTMLTLMLLRRLLHAAQGQTLEATEHG